MQRFPVLSASREHTASANPRMWWKLSSSKAHYARKRTQAWYDTFFQQLTQATTRNRKFQSQTFNSHTNFNQSKSKTLKKNKKQALHGKKNITLFMPPTTRKIIFLASKLFLIQKQLAFRNTRIGFFSLLFWVSTQKNGVICTIS